MARVHVIRETTTDDSGRYQLWFQWCRYDLDHDGPEFGYRFIWRRDEALQAARGQTRIPNILAAKLLMERAVAEGWGERDGAILAAAAERLREQGCVVSLESGYVGWPNKETAMRDHLTEQMLEDVKIIREWS